MSHAEVGCLHVYWHAKAKTCVYTYWLTLQTLQALSLCLFLCSNLGCNLGLKPRAHTLVTSLRCGSSQVAKRSKEPRCSTGRGIREMEFHEFSEAANHGGFIMISSGLGWLEYTVCCSNVIDA